MVQRDTDPTKAVSMSALSSIESLLRESEACLAQAPQEASRLAQEARTLAQAHQALSLEVQAAFTLARALLSLGQLGEAVQMAQAGVELASTFDESTLRLEGLRLLATILREQGDLNQASSYLEEAALLAQQANLPAAEADCLNQQAGIHHSKAEYAQALDKLTKALTLVRIQGNRVAEANVLNNIGILRTELGQYPLALEAFLEAYQLYRHEEHSPRNRAGNLASIGNLYMEMGNFEQADRYYELALAEIRRTQERFIELQILQLIAELAFKRQDYPRARDTYHGVVVASRELGLERILLTSLEGLAKAQMALGEPQVATQTLLEVLELARSKGWRATVLDVLLSLGEASIELKDLHQAQVYGLEALELSRQAERKRSTYLAHRLLARVHRASGEYLQAIEHLEEYHRLEREVFNEESERQRQTLMNQLELERVRNEAENLRLRTELERQAREEAQAKVFQRTQELEFAQLEIVSRLALAAEFRDDATGEHTYRVGRNAAMIAKELGWPQHEVETLRLAARLHDVGKIGIPDAILLKRDRLTVGEYELMKDHTTIGARILSGGRSKILRLAEEIALSHHEHFDGSGYPRGLAGDSIPMSGRIVAVADVLDALTHERPYKRAWSVAEALAEIKRQSGRQFDPTVVEACLAVFAEVTVDVEEHMQRLDSDLSLSVQLEKAQLGWADEEIELLKQNFEQLLAERTRELEQARREAQVLARRMELMAHTDVLTGLGNRRAFESDLESEVARAQRVGYSLSVLALDVDTLKQLNDTEGHERGDALLRTFAQAMQECFFELGRVYRIGGDEYAAILPYVDARHQAKILGRIETAILNTKSQGFPTASVSSGMASMPDEATSDGDLVRLSDQRMYQDKLERRRAREAKPDRPHD
ncbi:MAG: diguanylate cyclase [Meiothermus sp.]|uniref:Cyclic di-GMP phosphodiesterase response regulator RpfG n=1 Tax=Meiothermus hypogaeus TaxID=884155 RepID=A0ABX9MRA1_9DEIN|nr:Cyclic di-GMP phosphodiesterase response regulator RpfG [Meiothermus hypogaeus]GIW37914.1 MAG: diguanylate cyclase [Meiothermus sp.]